MMSATSSEASFPMAMTKTKRDEFLVEIRKSKNKTRLQQKRMKLYGFFEEGQMMGPITQEDGSYQTMNNINQAPAPIELSPEVKATLQEAYDKFFEAFNRQAWDELLPIIRYLREIIGDQQDSLPGRVIIEMEIVPHLIVLLSEKFCKLQVLQVEIAWLLANISAGSSEDCAYLAEQNIIPTLCECLKSSINEDLQENAMWTLANISGDPNLKYRDDILEAGALYQVVRELCKTPKKIVYYRTAAWLISNLVRGRPFPSYDRVAKCFSALTHLIDYTDTGIQQHTLLSLSYLTEEGKETHIKSMSENNLIPKVVSYISHKDEKSAINALKVTGNLALANRKYTHNLCEHDIFKAMPAVLTSPNPVLRREACITLANIFSNNDFDDHDYVIDYDIVPLLLELAAKDEDDTKAIAIQCLYRFMYNCSTEDAMVPVEKGLLKVLMQNLESGNMKIVENCLMALYKLLEHGENMKKENQGYNPFVVGIMQNNEVLIIENLLNNKDDNIFTKVSVLLERFFRFGQ